MRRYNKQVQQVLKTSENPATIEEVLGLSQAIYDTKNALNGEQRLATEKSKDLKLIKGLKRFK